MKSGLVCVAASLLLAALVGPAAAQAPTPSAADPAAPPADTSDARDQPLFPPSADDPLNVQGPNAPEPAERVGPAPSARALAPRVTADAAPPDQAQQADAPSAHNPDGSPADPPHFVSRPNETQLLQAYPGLALRMRKSGKAVIRCAVDVQGVLEDCTLLSETPAGMGFGQASLGLVRYYRVAPPLQDGRPLPGMTVVIPMKWLVG